MRYVKDPDSAANIVTIYGNSEETKPTSGISDGSVFVETDTLYIYMYDETNATWRQLA